MSRFSFGKSVPRGPAGAPFPISNDYATRREKGMPRAATNTRDKKGYTGSRAGIGHGGQRQTFSLPKGPGGARFASVQLPSRTAPKSAGARRPSLMNRIARRAAGFLGL